VQGDPRVAGQPGAHRRVLVRGVVVDHHVQLPARIGGGDLLEEAEKLLVAMALGAGVGDPAGATSRAANSVVVPCRT
jgi:hypothetical protein